MQEKPPAIDFAPIMRECQKYAKLMKDAVESGKLTEEQYLDITGYRVSIANSFCFLLFGEKFDEIRKGYLELVTKAARESG